MLSVDELVEAELATVFRSLQYTTILLNEQYHQNAPIDGTFIQQSLGYIHSKLIELDGRMRSELSSYLCLAMMAFLGTTFRLPGSYENYYCKSLVNKLRSSSAVVNVEMPDLQKTLEIWLRMVLLISSDHGEELDVFTRWEARELSWDETRRHLKQVMWIDAFQDDLGRRAFARL